MNFVEKKRFEPFMLYLIESCTICIISYSSNVLILYSEGQCKKMVLNVPPNFVYVHVPSTVIEVSHVVS